MGAYKPYKYTKKCIELDPIETAPDYILAIRKTHDGHTDKYYYCNHLDRATREYKRTETQL